MTPFGAWLQVEWIVREPHLEKARFGGAWLSSFCRFDGGHGQSPKNHPFRSSTFFGIDNDGAIGSGLNRAQAEIG